MIGNPLQLHGQAAEELVAGRNAGGTDGCDGAAVGGGMCDGAVAGEGLRIVDGARIGAAQHRSLHTAVLIAQRDFQMVDGLAVTLEAKMARFDDAGMNRTDGDFVNFVAGHPKEGDLAAR